MKNILIYGDSNTYGANPETTPATINDPDMIFRLGEGVRWPSVLQQLLGTDEYRIIEEGLCGRTTVFRDQVMPWCEGREYLKPCVLTHSPLDLVVIMLGTNDLKTAFNPNVNDLGQAMAELAQIVLNPFIYMDGKVPKLMIISPVRIGDNLENSFLYGMFDEKSRELSYKLPEAYRMTALRCGCEFMDAGEYAEPSVIDSVHMTPENHRKLAEAVCEKIKNIL